LASGHAHRSSNETEGIKQGVREHQSSPGKRFEDMSERLGSTAKGAEASGPGSRPDVPKEVQISFMLWLAAVAAGVIETIVRVIHSLSAGLDSGSGLISGVAIGLIIYVVVVYISAQMRLGKRWARITLAVLLGGIGTLSLVVDPISWLAGGNSLREVFMQADLLFAFIAPIRAVHLAAVLAALVFMFLPAANNYFRRASSPAGALGSRERGTDEREAQPTNARDCS
jgi:hypothetical protein